MDLLKALKRTTIISAVAVLALGATESRAADHTAVVGHVSASVTGNLAVAEVQPINFGNMTFTNCAPCVGGQTLTLSPDGLRTLGGVVTDGTTLMNGVSNAGTIGATKYETGAQSPGFYTINNTGEGVGTETVYISFANSAGAIMDAQHPINYVDLSNGTDHFYVNGFNFVVDDGVTPTGPSDSGYTTIAALPATAYGTPIALVANKATIRVGAVLTTVAGATGSIGQYTGTFDVMVSY